MKKRIAINGFGRIGRLTLRNLLEDKTVDVIAINDLTDNATLAHLFKYDTAHGVFPKNVSSGVDFIKIGTKKIKSYTERNPEDLPWRKLKVDLVLECTGVFRTVETAGRHIEAGAKKIILSAPPKGPGFEMIVLGVNQKSINKRAKYFSNASCTTNCLAPMLKVIIDNFGFVRGNMNTIHAYTADQRIQDSPHRDLRRARAAAQNIVPTSTGAAVAASVILPEVKGKLFASSFRVPVITGSLVELTCTTKKTASAEEINEAFLRASQSGFKGIIEYSEDELVSSDIVGNKHSTIFDSKLTQSTGKYIKIVAWYDNEAGYSARLSDLVVKV